MQKVIVFATVVQSYKGLYGLVSDDDLLENPNYFASILIFLQAKNIPFPDHLKKLLGARRLPEMEVSWMEHFLGLHYEDDIIENGICVKCN